MKSKILILSLIFSALFAGIVQSRTITGYDTNNNYEPVVVESGKYYPGVSLYPQLGALRAFVSEQVGGSPQNGYLLQTNGITSTWITPSFTSLTTTNFFATNTLFINATSTNLYVSGTTNLNGLTFTTASGTSITSTNAFFTNASSSNFYALTSTIHDIRADGSDGLLIDANNGTGVAILGAGNSSNALFYGGLTVNGALSFSTANGTSITSTNAFFSFVSSTSATSTNLNVSTLGNILKLGINSSSPTAQLAVQPVAGTDVFRTVSTTGAQTFAINRTGQVIVGPNSLAQSGQLSVETPTTNDYALTFTNGTHYTAVLGRQPGTSGQMMVGGLSGTTLNLWSGGSSRMVILNTNGYAGINSSTPYYQLAVSGTVAFSNINTNITGNGVCRTTAGEITDAGAAACVPSALKYKTNVSPYTKSATDLFSELVKVGAVDNYELKSKLGDSRKGLIADYVEKIDPDLVGYSEDGSINTLHFEDLTGLSVKAIAELDTRVKVLENKQGGNRGDLIQWGIIAFLILALFLKRK